MRTLRFPRTGDLDALQLAELDAPTAHGGDARVRVVAAGLNPSDVKNVLGRFPYTTLPRTPGRDFAGVVDQGPAGWLGQEVWGTGNELGFTRDGSHAEFVLLPVQGLAVRPKSLSFAQAAASGVPYTTALDALVRTGVGPGVRVVILGMGAVGKAGLDIAHWLGAEVVGAARRPEQLEHVRGRGAPVIALGEAEALHGAVAAHFASGADVIFDTTGAWLSAAIAGLAPLGRIAVIAAPTDGHVRVPVLALYRKGGTIVGVNSLLYDTRACAPMLARLAAAFDSGALRAPESPTEVPFEAGVETYRELNGGRSDKVVFAMRGAGA
jgi:NADPH2:quinone reductase